MDWSQLAGIIAPIAPKLGGLLGGLFGPFGSIAGTLAGNALAGVLGVAPTPAAVAQAIQADPAAQAKIQKLEDEHADLLIQQAQVQIAYATQAGLTDRENIDQVGATQRAELGQVSWWHWRHLIGYLVLAFGLMILAIMGRAAFVPGDNMTDFVNLLNATSFFLVGLFGLLGYVAQDTTRQKIVAATGAPAPTMTDNALSAVKSLAAKVTGRK